MELDGPSCPEFLVIFDIDWTLLVASGLIYRSIIAAYKALFGIKIQQPEDELGTGRTDPWMIREWGKRNGIDETEIDEKMDAMIDFVGTWYVENIKREGVVVLPGIPELLQKIDEKRYLRCIVTGGLEIPAYHKLQKCGLAQGFAFGAFGSDAEERSVLLELALQRAKDRCNFIWNGHNAMYVADSPLDVLAAKQVGLPVVIMIHGLNAHADFTGAEPLAFMKGTEDHDAFFDAIATIQGQVSDA